MTRREKLRDTPAGCVGFPIHDILKSHGALDQFQRLQAEASRRATEVENLRQRYEAAEKLEGAKTELGVERSLLNLRLRRDLSEQSTRIDDAIRAFEETSGHLYESAGSMQVAPSPNGPQPSNSRCRATAARASGTCRFFILI